MKYKEYKKLDYVEIFNTVLARWNKNDVFKKSIENRKNNPSYTFYEGPPSANGSPGIHHVMARAVKDTFCRYKTLKGFLVNRKSGWDAHGLPVELQVEKDLRISKEEIGKKISIENYNEKCHQTVMKYKNEWDDLTNKIGYWVDLDQPYVTSDKKYIESVWHILKKIYEKGYLYKGYTIQPYSPAAGTGLSSHELNQPGTYRDVKDTSVTAQFKITDVENEYFLAWTTTPWTLPSNTALGVGVNITYLKVETFNPYTHKRIFVVLAEDRLYNYFEKKFKNYSLDDYNAEKKIHPFKVVGKMKGKDLIGMKYEQLLPYVTPKGKAFEVIKADFVTTEDGTGIVHLSPTFGADDYFVTKKAGIDGIMVKDEKGEDTPLVDRQGKFVKEVTDFAGMYVKNEYSEKPPKKPLDVLIAIKLKEENKAFKVEKYQHSYPHCWRTDKPILYYPLNSWFIKTTAVKKRLVELNNTINWKPASTGSGRFGNWLENLVDWNLSRSRFWGTPLPIWMTEDNKEAKCIGSIQELKDEVRKAVDVGFMKKELEEDFDLHRPYVDDIKLVSSNGQIMHRELDLIDVWFDSGAMPFAQFHYPFENKDFFEKNYPADFIAEGVDQTRGWFFTLHAISVILQDNVAFKNVIANGLVLDKEGSKMSKRLGNSIDPFDIISTYGPDATRWYMINNSNPWDNLKFNVEGIIEVQRKFFSTLHNTYSFFAVYANLDDFRFDCNENFVPISESDRWIMSRLNSLIIKVDTSYQEYEPTRVTRLIHDFTINDLSNWYVRLNRKRFWKGEFNQDKKNAYSTLYKCLTVVAKLACPIAPFFMDNLFYNLNTVTQDEKICSIHLSNFPVVSTSLIDLELEKKMSLAQDISSLVHSLRKKHNIKVRQPLSRILLPKKNLEFKSYVLDIKELILTEVNVKEIEFIDNDSDILVKKIKPNFRKLGKVYGDKMKAINKNISQFSRQQINLLEANGECNIQLEDQTVVIGLDDVELSYQDIPGMSVATDGNITVALNVSLNDDLKKEGIARELVNRIQNQRKNIGLEVQDKINIAIEKNEILVNQSLEQYCDYICSETQAHSLNLVENIENSVKYEFDNYILKIKIEK